MVQRSNCGLNAPNSGIDNSNNACQISNQPRLRPSGGMYRSNSGAHKNFQVKGKLISANNPIDFKSTPSERNQAGKRLMRIKSGKPDVKPVKTQINMRLFISACQMLDDGVMKTRRYCHEGYVSVKSG